MVRTSFIVTVITEKPLDDAAKRSIAHSLDDAITDIPYDFWLKYFKSLENYQDADLVKVNISGEK